MVGEDACGHDKLPAENTCTGCRESCEPYNCRAVPVCDTGASPSSCVCCARNHEQEESDPTVGPSPAEKTVQPRSFAEDRAFRLLSPVHQNTLRPLSRAESETVRPLSPPEDPVTLPDECDACPCCADRCSIRGCVTCCRRSNKEKPEEGPGKYTWCTIRRHNSEHSLWLVAHGNVYDATEFLEQHPAGRKPLLMRAKAAADCSIDFDFHSPNTRRIIWQKYKIGVVVPCPLRGPFEDSRCTVS